MFIHWGLFSHLGGQWQDQTFYGIGEWIKRQMKISDADYMALAKEFNPTDFDARAHRPARQGRRDEVDHHHLEAPRGLRDVQVGASVQHRGRHAVCTATR